MIKEQYYLDLYKTYISENGYNISKNALAPMTGRKFSQESLLKLSESVKNRDSSCWIRGEDKFNSKFKNEDIIEIKKMIIQGCKIKYIAEKFNVEPNTITQIKTGERWSHIKTKYDDLIIQTPRQKLTEDDIIDIKLLLIENKLSIKEIAILYNITFGMVSSIKNLRSHKSIGEELNDSLCNRVYVNKLNKDMVIEIRKMLSENKNYIEISKIYDVDRITILNIKNNKTWKQVK